jgi:hypothetical protein
MRTYGSGTAEAFGREGEACLGTARLCFLTGSSSESLSELPSKPTGCVAAWGLAPRPLLLTAEWEYIAPASLSLSATGLFLAGAAYAVGGLGARVAAQWDH